MEFLNWQLLVVFCFLGVGCGVCYGFCLFRYLGWGLSCGLGFCSGFGGFVWGLLFLFILFYLDCFVVLFVVVFYCGVGLGSFALGWFHCGCLFGSLLRCYLFVCSCLIWGLFCYFCFMFLWLVVCWVCFRGLVSVGSFLLVLFGV